MSLIFPDILNPDNPPQFHNCTFSVLKSRFFFFNYYSQGFKEESLFPYEVTVNGTNDRLDYLRASKGKGYLHFTTNLPLLTLFSLLGDCFLIW